MNLSIGGIVLSGGLAGFVFTRNLTTLSNGVLFGGALLALSTFSLKVWRQGKSSFPFILGQAGIYFSRGLRCHDMESSDFCAVGFFVSFGSFLLCFLHKRKENE